MGSHGSFQSFYLLQDGDALRRKYPTGINPGSHHFLNSLTLVRSGTSCPEHVWAVNKCFHGHGMMWYSSTHSRSFDRDPTSLNPHYSASE